MEKYLKIDTETNKLSLIEGDKVTIINEHHLLNLDGDIHSITHYYDDVIAFMKPTKNIKPNLPLNHNSNQVKQYHLDLEQYEFCQKLYIKDKEIYDDIKYMWEKICDEYIKHKSGLYENVPYQYREKIYNLAWQQGHSHGYSEVYNHLIDLVDIFE